MSSVARNVRNSVFFLESKNVSVSSSKGKVCTYKVYSKNSYVGPTTQLFKIDQTMLKHCFYRNIKRLNEMAGSLNGLMILAQLSKRKFEDPIGTISRA